MKKIIALISIGVLVVGVIVGAVFLVNSGTNNNVTTRTEEYDITIPLNNIDISSNEHDIYVYPTTGDKIIIKVHEDNRYKSNITFENGTLSITMEKDNNFIYFFGYGKRKIEVFLPDQKCDMKIENISGDITVKDFKEIGNALFKTSSGDHYIHNSSFNDLKINLNSGEVTSKNIITNNFNLKTVSGDISLTNIVVNNNDCIIVSTSGEVLIKDSAVVGVGIINNTSGQIKILNSQFVELDLTTVSGDLRMSSLNNDIKYIKVKTSSGTTKIDFKDILGYKVLFNTVSGDYVSEYGNAHYYGDGSISLDITSVSGDIRITKVN